MATPKRGNAGRTKSNKTKTKKALEDENEKLRKSVERLKEINDRQLQRLVEQDLLKIRIKELEQQLSRKSDD